MRKCAIFCLLNVENGVSFWVLDCSDVLETKSVHNYH